MLLIMTLTNVFAQTDRAGEEINWQVLTGGGEKGQSTNYMLRGSVGQTATDRGSSGSYLLHHGFHQDLAGSFICDCEPGEVNGVTPVNILDIIYLIDFKFKSGPDPVPYPTCNGDVTCDCIVNILDIIYLIDFKFNAGPSPCTCDDWLTSCGPPLAK